MDFSKALQIHDSDFEDILEILKLKRQPEDVDSLRNLLLTVNLVIDYYINREDKDLKIPVTYFPICTEFAQEVCEEFVCLKFGLYSSKAWKSLVSTKINHAYFKVPSYIKKRELELAKENYKNEKRIAGILSKSINQDYEVGKTLIYSEYITKCLDEYIEANKSYNRKLVNKYWFLCHTINHFSKADLSDCPLTLVPKTTDELYDQIEDNEGRFQMENIVVFPTRTPDGRYSDYCSEAFQQTWFDDFIKLDTGLRNVFFFCFSKKPYKLRRLFDFKQQMKDHLQVQEEGAYDFISFTYKEALVLTNQQGHKQLTIQLGKDDDEIQQDYEQITDDITTGLDRYVSRRNEMSLCVSNSSMKSYGKKLADETEADSDLINNIFRVNLALWKNTAETTIRHFVYNDNIFVITGNEFPTNIKDDFSLLLQHQYGAYEVRYGTFADLRGYQKEGKYLNDIEFNKILIVSFRNDYTESIFHKYPNSFDPYCINPEQIVLEVSNYYFMRQYYDWGRYNYGKAIRKVLKSDFRASEMKPQLIEYKRPTKRLVEDTRDEEFDRNTTRTVQQISVVYDDNSSHSFIRSEWMLYKNGSNTGIATLADLCGQFSLNKELRVQPLAPLVKSIYRSRVDSEREKDSRNERKFKEQSSFGLSKEEINSNSQLWKILLERRINEKSCKIVYDEIMSHFNERYKVSYHSFKRWIDPEYGMPRARKMQKFLVEDYLGIKPPYINVIRRIKERTKSDTESITTRIRHFLNIALLNNDYDNVLRLLSEEIKDLLDISCSNDINNIITIINEKIKFELVKSIQQ